MSTIYYRKRINVQLTQLNRDNISPRDKCNKSPVYRYRLNVSLIGKVLNRDIKVTMYE